MVITKRGNFLTATFHQEVKLEEKGATIQVKAKYQMIVPSTAISVSLYVIFSDKTKKKMQNNNLVTQMNLYRLGLSRKCKTRLWQIRRMSETSLVSFRMKRSRDLHRIMQQRKPQMLPQQKKYNRRQVTLRCNLPIVGLN